MKLKAKLRKWQARGTMRNRLIRTYALGIVLPLIILGALFISSASLLVEHQLVALTDSSVSHMADRLESLFQSYTRLSDQYVVDPLFLQSLRRKYGTVMDSYDLYSEIWTRNGNNLLAWPNIRYITIYTGNPTLVSSSPFVIRSGDYLEALPSYGQIQQAKYKGLWSGVRTVNIHSEYWNPKNDNTSGPLATFTYNRTLQTGGTARSAEGMITVEIHDDALQDILSDGVDAMQSVLVDGQGALMSGGMLPGYLAGEALKPPMDGYARLENEDGNYLVWRVGLANGWTLLSAVSLDLVTRQANQMRAAALLILAALAALALAAIGLISSALTRRVRLLVDKMHREDGGTPAAAEEIGGNDEIHELDLAFTAMARRLRDSAQRQYGAEVRRREAELELLHTQINPHFLYNMLSAIAWLADSRPAAEVRAAVERLAGYYRLTLARGREVITLGEEIEGLMAYMELQRLRYAGRMRCLVQIDESLMDAPIPRLTLQPLVENSITHGAGGGRRAVSIVISAQVSGSGLELTVRDDGVGMDAERLEQLQQGHVQSENGSGLGYRNVNERIRLHFGQDYGLSVSSAPGEGTSVLISLPLPGCYGDIT